IYDCAGRYITGAVTNASGVYTTAAVLETGTYYSYAYLPGFALEIYSDVLLPINDDITNGTPINVTSGATTSSINYSLLPAGSAGGISGTITNGGTAAPVATSIYVFDAAGGFVDSTSSNGAGAYTTVTPLKTGTYYVYAYGTGGLVGEYYNDIPCFAYFLCSPMASTPVSVTTGSVTPGIDFALSPGGRITGTVTATSGGAPIAATAYFYDSSNNFLDSDGTDGAGVYLSNIGLANGNYFVRVASTTDQSFEKELYNNILCEPSCTANTGTPVATTAGTTTS